MDQNVIQNVADHYASEYGLMDRLSNLKELINNHDVEPFYISLYIISKKLICSKNTAYTAEIHSRREHHLLEDIKNKLFIKVKNRKVVEELVENEYLNEIYLTIAVYKYFFILKMI